MSWPQQGLIIKTIDIIFINRRKLNRPLLVLSAQAGEDRLNLTFESAGGKKNCGERQKSLCKTNEKE